MFARTPSFLGQFSMSPFFELGQEALPPHIKAKEEECRRLLKSVPLLPGSFKPDTSSPQWHRYLTCEELLARMTQSWTGRYRPLGPLPPEPPPTPTPPVVTEPPVVPSPPRPPTPTWPTEPELGPIPFAFQRGFPGLPFGFSEAAFTPATVALPGGMAVMTGARLSGMGEETAWFEANRGFIAQQYAGMWVVVKDQSVRGAYPDFQSAYNAGVAMFGTEPFLVKQALAQEPVMRA
jgi:hypothetical protein